jgi:adenine-specific DNA-methyltransferase
MEKIVTKEFYNRNLKKHYYFLVINKRTNNTIVNSIKGLSHLTKNENNLPFQINWSKNTVYKYKHIDDSIALFCNLFSGKKTGWRTKFLDWMHENGQYFTTNSMLKQKVKKFVLNTGSMLEPCIGQGDLVDIFNKDRKIDMYEIDASIDMLPGINTDDVIFTDFLTANISISKKYDTIISNPPYIKKDGGNLYIKFIEKCFEILSDTGEMIFIIPSDFFKITHSSSLIIKMCECGSFTDIYHPHDEHLFGNASIDVLIFRYSKIKSDNNCVMYNDNIMYANETNGILTFFNDNNKRTCISELFLVKVGIVSGADSVFNNNVLGNVDILCSSTVTKKAILIDTFPTGESNVDSHLLSNKTALLARKIRHFNDNNWFEWGALRNIKFVKEHIGKPCIYVQCLTRNGGIAFTSTVQLFSGNLILLLPKEPVDLQKIVDYMNTDAYKQNYIYAGRFKIGQKQLLNSSIVL